MIGVYSSLGVVEADTNCDIHLASIVATGHVTLYEISRFDLLKRVSKEVCWATITITITITITANLVSD